ncbi:MAG: hypothetical protein EAY81_04770 [Bacteroidetes bacterium]|nr:MAG: hypothetical protein EAY81_04770 [Bacteroidota bacterium]
MKKILYSLVLGAIFFGSCKDDSGDEGTKTTETPKPTIQVEDKTTALFIKTSGTKCPPCGGWGWQVSEAVIAENQEAGTAYYMGIFSANFVSEGFITTTANEMDSKWAINSWPSFFVGSTKVSPAGSTVTAIAQGMQEEIDVLTEEKPIANTGVKYTVADGKMMIESSLQFFKAAEGTYHVAFYVIENDALWKQSGHSQGANPIPHHYVLRGAANGTWGTSQATGTIAAGTIKNDIKGEMVIDPSWKMENVSVYSVIWKKVGTKYEFVNVSKSK